MGDFLANCRRRARPSLVAPVTGLLLLGLGGAGLASITSGVIGPRYRITGNGHHLHPAGHLTTVGDFPNGSAVLPGGRFLWVVDCGHGKDDAKVIRLSTGKVVQTLPLPGCYGGIAFDRHGTHAYISGEPVGGEPKEGKTMGDQGDVIHIFRVSSRTGRGVEQAPLQVPASSGGSGRTNSLPPTGNGVGTACPEGIAVSPNSRYLVVALNCADRADVVKLATKTQTLVSVGQYPEGVAFDPQGRAYVSNEYSGTVSVINPAAARVTATVSGLGGRLGDLASHPEGMVADPRRSALYVAVTDRDLVAVVNTRTGRVKHLISVGRPQGLGTAPTNLAISPDGTTLYASDAGEDAVAVMSLSGRPTGRRAARHGFIPGLPAYRLIGRIPTAAYPDSVQTTSTGKLIWVAGKGFGSGPNPSYYFGGARTPYQTPPNAYGTYVLDMLIGRVGRMAIPTDRQVRNRWTAIANRQYRPDTGEARPVGSPIPATTGHPSSQIKHVFYIVRENRTYDQIFGSDPRGDGRRQLELFADNGVAGPTGGVTPNAHSLARRFPLFDHFYEDSEVSVDGHLITTGAYATDYVQKATAANYSGRRGTYDFGIYPVTFPPRFFLFDQAVKQHVSFKDYGEAVGATPLGKAPNRPDYTKVQEGVDFSFPNNLFIGCLSPGVSCTQDSGIYKGTGTLFATQSRFNVWYPKFQAQVATNSVPSFTYMILPNDHTNGTTSGDYTPQAMIADNDLALGQVVDAISHSKIWKSSAIFVVEDDSQDGADHIDSHRSPAFVISPWARQGAVVGTRYDQYSMLRTLELILGLDPLALNDALATPMYDAFISGNQKPNDAPYNVVEPKYPINKKNTKSAPDANLSSELPWNQLDAVPQAISDQILWHSVFGAGSRPPGAGPNASPDEVERAIVMRYLLRRAHENPASAAARAWQAHGATCPITWACRKTPPGDL